MIWILSMPARTGMLLLLSNSSNDTIADSFESLKALRITEKIRKTRFAIRPTGQGYEFYVTDQTPL